MKRILTILAIMASAAALLASCGRGAGKSAKIDPEQALADSIAAAEQAKSVAAKLAAMPEEPMFDIITTEGVIRIRLYSQTPKHRENFAKLAFEGFYDGTLFHRVIKGFMIQGGDPLTKDEANADKFGTGGSGYTVEAEFVPEYTHKKGALAAARRGGAANPMKESSGSQFYLVQDAQGCSHLDGDYTIFGETVNGLGVIDRIASIETDGRSRPVVDVKIITIKFVEENNSGTAVANEKSE